jgi:hypothetical protein
MSTTRHTVSAHSEALFLALIKIPIPIWTVGVPLLSRQLNDRLAYLLAVGKGLEEESLIAFLHNLYTDRLF